MNGAAEGKNLKREGCVNLEGAELIEKAQQAREESKESARQSSTRKSGVNERKRNETEQKEQSNIADTSIQFWVQFLPRLVLNFICFTRLMEG